MKVLCVGPLVPEEAGHTPGFTYPLIVGVEYSVRAMALMNMKLAVLVVSKDGWPTWFPIELFQVVDSEIARGWEFAARAGALSALWGYPTLIRDPDHIRDLRLRKNPAVEAFLRESGVGEYDAKTERFID